MPYLINSRRSKDQESAFPCADRALYNAWFNLWFLNDAGGSNSDCGVLSSSLPLLIDSMPYPSKNSIPKYVTARCSNGCRKSAGDASVHSQNNGFGRSRNSFAHSE